MEFNELINQFFDILDKNIDIMKIKRLKKELVNNQELLNNINEYHLIKTVESKKKLYENATYLEYLQSETNINLLIRDIEKKLKIFHSRKCYK